MLQPNVTWTIYPHAESRRHPTLPTGTTTAGRRIRHLGRHHHTWPAATPHTTTPSRRCRPSIAARLWRRPQAMGIPQGDILFVASVPIDPEQSLRGRYRQPVDPDLRRQHAQGPPSVYLTPSTPTTPAGLTNPVVTVAHNGGTLSSSTAESSAPRPASPPRPALRSAPAVSRSTPPTTPPIWEVGPAPFSLSTACPRRRHHLRHHHANRASTPLRRRFPPAASPSVILVSHLVPTVNNYAYIGVN